MELIRDNKAVPNNKTTLLNRTAIQGTAAQLPAASDDIDLLGMAAHELKNPLFAIRLATRFLANRAGSNSVDDTQSLCNDIEECLTHVFTMIDNMLGTARAGHNIGRQGIGELCLAGAVERVLARFKHHMRSKNIDVELLQADPGVYVLADADALDHVLDNLIANAVKFSPTGSCIRITLSREWNKVACAHRGQISICDEGPGFSRSDVKKMWGKFERLSAQPTQNESSTGLGLALCKRIVEQMYGVIDCNNRSEGGARFFVQLPVVQAIAA